MFLHEWIRILNPAILAVLLRDQLFGELVGLYQQQGGGYQAREGVSASAVAAAQEAKDAAEAAEVGAKHESAAAAKAAEAISRRVRSMSSQVSRGHTARCFVSAQSDGNLVLGMKWSLLTQGSTKAGAPQLWSCRQCGFYNQS